jgi:hypothetical protein
MKNLIWILIILNLSITINAQHLARLDKTILEMNYRGSLDYLGKKINLNQVKGSPYLNANFEKGYIVLNELKDTLQTRLRYNIYSDEIEVKVDSTNAISALKKANDIACHFSNKDFVYIENSGYFQLLSKGKATLYLQYKSEFQDAQPGLKPPMQEEIPAKFTTKKTYFIFLDGVMNEVPFMKSKFYRIFGELEEKIKQYADDHKLKFSNEGDLIKIVAYYNTL